MKIDDLVGKYVALRDRKAQIKKHYDAKTKAVNDMLEKIEAVMLKLFNDTGVDSVKTPLGTAYKNPRVSITVADRDAFLAWVLADFEDRSIFLDARAAKASIEQYKEANEDLPPGVNYTSDFTVGFRSK